VLDASADLAVSGVEVFLPVRQLAAVTGFAIRQWLTSNQAARTSWVVAGCRCTRVTSKRSPNTSLYFAPAASARRRGRLVCCRACHAGPTSATSSAITRADKPVTCRPASTAARPTPRSSHSRSTTTHEVVSPRHFFRYLFRMADTSGVSAMRNRYWTLGLAPPQHGCHVSSSYAPHLDGVSP
jgi:hypothetical protein